MLTKYQIENESDCYFLTLQIVEWVDLFSRKCYRDIVIDSLKFCTENKGLIIYSYVIMSNHIHLIVKSNTDNLSGTIADFKSFTAKAFLKTIHLVPESRRNWMLNIFKNSAEKNSQNANFQIWLRQNHAEHIHSKKFFLQKLNYIHNNPVRAGIVQKPSDYLHSSAGDYSNKKGLVAIKVISTV